MRQLESNGRFKKKKSIAMWSTLDCRCNARAKKVEINMSWTGPQKSLPVMQSE